HSTFGNGRENRVIAEALERKRWPRWGRHAAQISHNRAFPDGKSCNGWARGASKEAMKKRIALCFMALLLPAFAAAACGGGHSHANQPSNPPASSASEGDAAA